MKLVKKGIAFLLVLILSSSSIFDPSLFAVFFTTNAYAGITDIRITYTDSNLSKRKIGIPYQYSDSFFDRSATAQSINEDLALASVALSCAAYSEKYITDALRYDLGCEDFKTFNYYATEKKLTKKYNDIVAFAVGKKVIKKNGENYYLYPIFVKGTGGNYEWYSNFNLSGAFTYHDGFMNAACDALQQLSSSGFINSPKNKTILWIGGHSRGAAVANLMAGILSYNNKYSLRDNTYCYTYACPAVATQKFINQHGGSNCKNIHNFNNLGDLVPYVPLSNWGYQRFGQTHTLNHNSSAIGNVKKNFKNWASVNFAGLKTCNDIISVLYSVVPSVKAYSSKTLEPISDSFVGGLLDVLKIKVKEKIAPEQIFYALADAVLIDNYGAESSQKRATPKTDSQKTIIINNIINSVRNAKAPIQKLFSILLNKAKNRISTAIFHGHCQELYLAWMNSVYHYSNNWKPNIIQTTNNTLNNNTSSSSFTVIYKKGAYSVSSMSGLNLRSKATTNSTSLAVIPNKTALAVTEVSNGWGKTEYNGKTGWVYLYYATYLGANIQPEAPALRLTSNTDIALGDAVSVSWNTVKFASKYHINIIDIANNRTVKSYQNYTGTTVSYVPEASGVYKVTARAANSAYQSKETTLAQQIHVHPDVTVRFMTGDEENGYQEYQVNTVKWGGSLSSMPEIPAKIGKNFKGWYKEDSAVQANFDVIKDDLTVYARYQAGVYTVRFYDSVSGVYLPVTLENGETVTQQKIEYGNAAVAPSDYSFVKEGYHFVGWNKKFDSVIENMTITAVTDYDNYNLPVEISDVTATRYQYGYEILCNVTNLTNDDTRGRVVVALKTDEGKLITTTESAAYFILGKETQENGEEAYHSELIKVIVPNYDDELEKNITADRAEVYAVANFKTTVPVSSNVEVGIADMDPWTKWYSEDEFNNLPASKKQKYFSCVSEEKIQYASSTPVYTTTNNETERDTMLLEGWTQYNVTSTTTTSGWSSTAPQEKPNRVINTKTVPAKTETTYWYKRYKYYNKAKGAYYYTYGSTWASNQGYTGKWEYKSSSTELEYLKTVDGKREYVGVWFQADCNTNQGTEHTVYKVTKTITPQHTEYQTIDTNYTYYMNRWSDFSEWTTTPIMASDTVNVVTRALHRYYANDLEHISDTEGEIRTDFISGSIGEEFAGKQATLFIYKVTEASDWTTEYLAQTIIADNGSYFFDPYKLREEPSISTGDYTVTLGIEGSNSAIYLGTIEAPKPQYQVTFVSPVNDETTVFMPIPVEIAGETVEIQSVVEGKDAVVPDAPAIEGKTFVGWDMRSTSVSQDLEIRAQYITNSYVVTFVDWANETYEMQTYLHGEELLPPVLNDTESMTALGWDKVLENNPVVTSNMVVSAVYEPKSFTVEMYDYTMNTVLNVQEVSYGESPELPELEDTEDCVYLGYWDVSDFDNVQEDTLEISDDEDLVITSNTYLYPSYVFVNTAETPTASLESGSYSTSQSVSLASETDSAVIYYTLDGSDPAESETAIEYTAPFIINETCELRMIASAFNMNTSDEVHKYYVINSPGIAKKAVVSLSCFDEIVKTFIAPVGSKLDASSIPNFDGYSFLNAYKTIEYDDSFENLLDDTNYYQYSDIWDISTDTIIEDTTIYLDYSPDLYTVRFIDYDGFVISETEVSYGDTAEEPENMQRDGYVFTGWDSNAFVSVTENLEINATYVDENDYTRISLDKTQYSSYPGTSFKLNAAVEGSALSPELVWYSTNENVAIVSDNGTVTMQSKGIATIGVFVVENGECAECDITVYADSEDELTLSDSSYLTISNNGYLLGFTISTEDGLHHSPTVAQIRSEFLSTGLVFTDVFGETLAEDAYVGTGTVIHFANSENDEEAEQIVVVVTGDMDGDGFITNRDASRVARYLVDKEEANDVQLAAIDVNGDGRVNNRDASMLARYLVGKETI